jgi:hypothetical protein
MIILLKINWLNKILTKSGFGTGEILKRGMATIGKAAGKERQPQSKRGPMTFKEITMLTTFLLLSCRCRSFPAAKNYKEDPHGIATASSFYILGSQGISFAPRSMDSFLESVNK